MATLQTIIWSNEDYEIRPAKDTDEFREVWWGFMQVLGWNRGYYDLDSYMKYSNGSGMILLIHKLSGKPVGHAAAIINDNSTGWVTMFIIDAAHRQKGMGAQLFKAATEDFKRHGTQIVGLDAVVEQRATYERRKFVVSRLGGILCMQRPLCAKMPVPITGGDSGALIDLKRVPRELLAQHELKCTGFYRPKLWTDELMFSRPDMNGIAHASRKDPQTIDDLHGWALSRRCTSGVRIGPVYAKNAASAKQVLTALMNASTPDSIKQVPLPNEPMNDWSKDKVAGEATLITEVSEANTEAVKLFEELGWADAGVKYFRMWFDGKSTPEQSDGGLAQKGVFAIFDAAVG